MSYALWAVSRSFPLFVLARIVAGFSKGNIGISTAVVVDVTPVDRRNRGMVSLIQRTNGQSTTKYIAIADLLLIVHSAVNHQLCSIRFSQIASSFTVLKAPFHNFDLYLRTIVPVLR